MKTFLTLFVLLFSSSVLADDISDFEIEGMSLGDSLLDYFSEQKIKNNIKDYIKDKKFSFFEIYDPSLFKNYESLQVSYKTGDIDYTIYGISGAIFYIDNIDECYLKKNNIVKELESLLIRTTKKDYGKVINKVDKSGESKMTTILFTFDSKDDVEVSCYDWSKKFEKKYATDSLRILLRKKEYIDWLNIITFNEN